MITIVITDMIIGILMFVWCIITLILGLASLAYIMMIEYFKMDMHFWAIMIFMFVTDIIFSIMIMWWIL